VSVTVVVWVVVPLLPETVMVWFPSAALLPTVMVIVDVPLPVIEAGLKEAEFWLPCPEAESATDELKPPVAVEVMVTLPEPLRAMLIVVGDALIEKPGVTPLTVRLTVVVSTVLPDVPVTVMLYVPGAAVEPTVNCSVELPEPPLIGLVPNAAVTPPGSVDVVNVTAELNEPTGETVIVELPELPCATVNDDGEAERLKPDVCVPPVSALMRPKFGLPHPVTRSKPVTAE
jgi:hypothetical protein